MAEKLDSRTVVLHSETLRQRKIDLGFSNQTLATKAKVSLRTITNAMNNIPIHLESYNRIAEALDYKSEDKSLLILNPSASSLSQNFAIKVGIVITGNLKSFAESQKASYFLELLKNLVDASDGKIQLTGFGEGSVIVYIQMEENDVLKLVKMFPNFHEYSREAIRRMPYGEAYFGGEGRDNEAAVKISEILEVADSVRELRIAAINDLDEDIQDDTQPGPEPKPRFPQTTIENLLLLPLDLDALRAHYAKFGSHLMMRDYAFLGQLPPSKERDFLRNALWDFFEASGEGI
ncbi:hypothetical protein [Fimbriiglobus ruber]|uniref:hypothetical protein n=1 Tax=Fimbriiglobus ruber TaxID=1908690 RepID=UPI00117B603C|nr:hypothetical protein [Fimbriiglobus ruber]